LITHPKKKKGKKKKIVDLYVPYFAWLELHSVYEIAMLFPG